MKFRISRRADSDLDAIWNLIATDNTGAADRVEQALHSAMHLLTEFPELGHSRPDVSDPRYRFWKVFD